MLIPCPASSACVRSRYRPVQLDTATGRVQPGLILEDASSSCRRPLERALIGAYCSCWRCGRLCGQPPALRPRGLYHDDGGGAVVVHLCTTCRNSAMSCEPLVPSRGRHWLHPAGQASGYCFTRLPVWHRCWVPNVINPPLHADRWIVSHWQPVVQRMFYIFVSRPAPVPTLCPSASRYRLLL